MKALIFILGITVGVIMTLSWVHQMTTTEIRCNYR